MTFQGRLGPFEIRDPNLDHNWQPQKIQGTPKGPLGSPIEDFFGQFVWSFIRIPDWISYWVPQINWGPFGVPGSI